MAKYGEQLARRFECPCMILEGAHFVTRECGPEINLLLNHLVHHGQCIHSNPHKYLKPDRPVIIQDKGATVEAVTLLQCSIMGNSSNNHADRVQGILLHCYNIIVT